MNSKWTGFGRKFFESTGTVWYEGECLDNVPNGFGKYYHPRNGALWYEGHFKNGKFDGFGRLTDAAEGDGQTVLYVGEWKNGLKHGLGTYYYDREYVFEGRWKDDMKVEGTVTYLNQQVKQVFFTERDIKGSSSSSGPNHFL